MRFVIFGLSISSSWGNGHATIWRGLLRAMAAHGHSAVFYEKDVPYYAGTRDDWECPNGIQLRLYDSFNELRSEARREVAGADVAVCTSYCPDAVEASRLIWDSSVLRVYYDLDTPVTMSALHSGQTVAYLPPEGLGDFDLVLSYTGGQALEELQSQLGARRVAPLYGAFDPATHHPVPPEPTFHGALSYLGTYAADRQPLLEELFVRPAARLNRRRFVLAGAQYPADFPWRDNIYFLRHLPPADHPLLFSSCSATLNVTRRSMAENGYCPSGRLFEAAACGSAIVSDEWKGLEHFFTPGEEILPVRCTDDVVEVLGLCQTELSRIGKAARERALACHTAAHRVTELEQICASARATGSHRPVAA